MPPEAEAFFQFLDVRQGCHGVFDRPRKMGVFEDRPRKMAVLTSSLVKCPRWVLVYPRKRLYLLFLPRFYIAANPRERRPSVHVQSNES